MKLLDGYSIPVEMEDGMLWAKHQLETYRALQKHDVVINTYPTGSGKTLALLNAIRKLDVKRVLIIAPINQLIYQYENEVKEFVRTHSLPHKVVTITSESLDEMGRPHAKALKDLLDEFTDTIAVSNPDIVHYVIMQTYGRRQMAGDLFVRLLKFPQLVAFDEFHYYDLSRIFFMIVLLASSKYFQLNQKFVFMTATPNEGVLSMLEKLGMRYSVIALNTEGGESQKAASPLKIGFLFGKMEDHVDEIIHVLKENPDKDVLVISNSLKRLINLASSAKREGLDIGMVTGPMDSTERKRALEKRMVFSTPTVDIGYDFKRPHKNRQSIDIVIFEAWNHDQFAQRLGRAGRVFGKPNRDIPSIAYVVLPKQMEDRALEALEKSQDRIQLNEAMKSAFRDRKENLKREYLGPQRLLIGLYEDAFKLIFPEEKHGDSVRDMIDGYYKLLESIFDFKSISRLVKRTEIDFYYFSKHLENREETFAKRILERNQTLLELITANYDSEEELREAAKLYVRFVEDHILSFRPTRGNMVYVLDEDELTGAKEFLYDETYTLTQYVVEPIPFEEIPATFRRDVRKGFKLIKPLDQNIRLSLDIRTKSKQRFFVPLKMKTRQYFSGSGGLRFCGSPVYLLDGPNLRRLSYLYDFHPIEALVNGTAQKVLIGLEAIKAQSYFSEKPWECDLFPL